MMLELLRDIMSWVGSLTCGTVFCTNSGCIRATRGGGPCRPASNMHGARVHPRVYRYALDWATGVGWHAVGDQPRPFSCLDGDDCPVPMCLSHHRRAGALGRVPLLGCQGREGSAQAAPPATPGPSPAFIVWLRVPVNVAAPPFQYRFLGF